MVSKSTTINFFSHLYIPKTGGIERYTASFANELAKLGYTVNIITTNSGGLETSENVDGIAVYRFKSLNFINGRFPIPHSVTQFFKVYQTFFKNKDTFVILNSRLFLTSLLGLIIGKLAHSKIILIEHGSGHIDYANPLFTKLFAFYEHLITLVYRVAGIKFYGVSKASSAWLTHFGLCSSGEIYNGVNVGLVEATKSITDKLVIPNDKKLISYVGRMIKEKGVLELLEAFKRFKQHNDEYSLVLIGEGELENVVEASANSDSNIHYLGKQSHDQVLKLLARSALFVNPSNYVEGLPTTLLEAGLFKVPVISTPNGGAKEVIIDNVTGILIEHGTAEQILEALESSVHDQRKMTRIGEKLGELVRQKLSWELIAKDFAYLF